MNASLLTSDCATHLKIAITALLATTLVVVIGICAQPPSAAHGSAVQSIAGPAAPVANAGHAGTAAR